MKIFTAFSALILCFVIHGVLTGHLIPSTRIVLDKCFQNFYSNNCSEDFEKVISTVSNKFCCIKFIYNEKNDDEALQNNAMTSSGNGNENMTTNIMISREAYDDSITTDDVSTDTKVDNVKTFQNSMLDETDSINMNKAIDDSSELLIENSIDSQLNGATDDKDDDAKSMQKAGENFENIESNLNANEIENELSETRMENQEKVETLMEDDDEIEDLSDENTENDEENEELFEEAVPSHFNEDIIDNLVRRLPASKKKNFDEYPEGTSEEFEDKGGSKLNQDILEVDLDKNTENEDKPAVVPDKSEKFSDGEYLEDIEISNKDDELSMTDENYSEFDTKSKESDEELIESNKNKDLDTGDSSKSLDKKTLSPKEQSIDINKSLEDDQIAIELESDLDINNQLDKINESSNDDVEMSKALRSSDSNQENESSEDGDSVDKNLISDNVSLEFQNEVGGIDEFNENQIDDNFKSEIPNSKLDDENSEEVQESFLQDSDSSNEQPEKSQKDLENPPAIPKLTTQSPFLKGSGRRSKLSKLNKFKSNQPSLNNKSPQKSFKKQFTNKLAQRGQRLNSKKKQSNSSLKHNPSKSETKIISGVDGHFQVDGHNSLDLNSGQSLEVNENAPETHSSSNDDDANEFQEQHDNVESRHEDVMNGNSKEMNHDDDDENENSLNNPKSSSESFSIETDLNRIENVHPDTDSEEENNEVKKSRQQKISKLSKQSPASDSNDSLQIKSDNLVENESNQVEDSVTEKVKNDNNELQFENSIDENRQRGNDNLQHEYNQVDDNDREYENDELKNNQIEDEFDGNEGDEMATLEENREFTRESGNVKRRPALINKFGVRVNRKDPDDTRKSNIVETIDNQVEDTTI